MSKESHPKVVKEVTEVIWASYLLKTIRDIDVIHVIITIMVSPSN